MVFTPYSKNMKKTNKKIKLIAIVFLMIMQIAISSFAVNIAQPACQKEEEKHLIYQNNEDCLDRMILVNSEPAYKLSSKYENDFNYKVDNLIELDNKEIIKILQFGYPYKTTEELNCNDEFEVYVATQEAIYTVYDNRDINSYEIKDEKGERIYNAMKLIIENAKSYNFEKELNLQIIALNDELVDDETQSDYMKKEYEIKANRPIRAATIAVETGEGIILSKNYINKEEKFKVLIPKDNLTQNINIKITLSVKDYQMQYGTANENTEKSGVIYLHENFTKHDYNINIKKGELSTIKITNIDKTKRTGIEGNKFELLDENFAIVKSDLVTDNYGKITIENIPKGTYYLKQTETTGEYCVNKTNMLIEVTGEERIINVKITNDVMKNEKTETLEKEINIEEENQNIEQINNKEITNIYSTNTYKDITNNTIQKNRYNNNDFVNTNNVKNLQTIRTKNSYRNLIEQIYNDPSSISNEYNYNMTKEDFMNLFQLITSNSGIERLPKAGV